MTNLTVAALKALSAGERLAAGRAVYVRANTDSSLSVTLRVKREGRQIDLKTGLYKATPSMALISQIWRDADAMRANADAHIERKAEREVEPENNGRLVVSKGSTLGEVWTAYIAEVKRLGKWTERNLKANENRASAHFAGWYAWDRPAAELTPQDVSSLIGPLRAKSPAQAKKLCGLLRLALTFAKTRKIAISKLIVDEALEELNVTAPRAAAGRNHHSLDNIADLRKLYRAIDGLSGSASVRGVLKLQALTCMRTGEVVGAEWSEFDLAAAVPTWTVPRSRMKIKVDGKGRPRPDHVIHLSPAAVELVNALPRNSDYVFPGRTNFRDHVSDTAISQAMRRDLGMEGRMVPHGWRASMKTLATGAVGEDGRPLFDRAWTETVLDHVAGDQTEQAYQRGGHFAQAGTVLAWWADQLTN